ncbi:CPBP family intramembrane glutamic endopeptidase [Halorientalis brevis]|uniref:CPBP family intramembrane glutamic endopeptidase n=1 Tax=Halorientalis brevis TaxID=1126241 RepID=A0ABD6C9N6_9EURY|nr:type II CAAX endopeptidase family protein [Halorientalis brevis]
MAETASRSKLGATLVTSGVAVAGSILSILTAVPVVLVLQPGSDLSASPAGFAALFVASYVGYALAGVAYLAWSDRGFGYLDVEIPDVRDLLYVVVGIVGVFAAVIALGVLISLLDTPSTPHNLFEPGMNPQILLVLIPLVLFVNAPVEELVFRNVVQKRLAESFSTPSAVVLASVIFGVVHLPSYYNPDLRATAVSLGLVTVASLVFGAVYAKTDNVVVPSVVHGVYNAVQIGLFYLFVSADQTLTAGLVPSL